MIFVDLMQKHVPMALDDGESKKHIRILFIAHRNKLEMKKCDFRGIESYRCPNGTG